MWLKMPSIILVYFLCEETKTNPIYSIVIVKTMLAPKYFTASNIYSHLALILFEILNLLIYKVGILVF